MNDFFKDSRVRWFAIGAIAITALVKFVQSETFKKGCVKALAGGMKFKSEAEAQIDKIREDAQDICFEASKQAKGDDIDTEELLADDE